MRPTSAACPTALSSLQTLWRWASGSRLSILGGAETAEVRGS